ncbi:MAG: type II secretion system F family protein [Alkalimonas sp.]|nr:type II secretion system F family protein [Alkalimonas sp.]
MQLLIITSLIGSILLATLFLIKVCRNIPKDNRDYMDPLTPGLKLIWPLVRFISYFVIKYASVNHLEKLTIKLRLSGLSWILTSEHYISLRILSSIGLLFIVYMVTSALNATETTLLVMAALFGYYLPMITLRDIRKKREQQIIRDLPVYLDFLTMCVETGLSIDGAIAQAVEHGPKGPLNVEFSKVLRDVRAGMSKTQAFKALSSRLQITEVNTLVGAMAQSEKSGSNLGSIMRIQAQQRRIERFQKAEKKALEAPVKLVFPLIVFIFPVTFMILAFPIAMKLMYEM